MRCTKNIAEVLFLLVRSSFACRSRHMHARTRTHTHKGDWVAEGYIVHIGCHLSPAIRILCIFGCSAVSTAVDVSVAVLLLFARFVRALGMQCFNTPKSRPFLTSLLNVCITFAGWYNVFFSFYSYFVILVVLSSSEPIFFCFFFSVIFILILGCFFVCSVCFSLCYAFLFM